MSAMETRSYVHLPSDILDIICSLAPVSDCARVAQASRTLFSAALPYIWYYVPLERLLLLLPGSRFIDPEGSTIFETNIPDPPPDDYFDRFSFYTPLVRKITYDLTWNSESEFISHHERTWPFVLSYVSTRMLIPDLRSLHFHVPGFAEENSVGLDWFQVLLSPSLTTFKSVMANDIDRRANLRVLQDVFSGCPRLTRLDLLGSHGKRPRVTYIDDLTDLNAPQSLQSIYISSRGVKPRILLWMSQLPRLDSLEIYLPRPPASSLDIPQGSFPRLTYLKISGRLDALLQVWDTPMVAGLTRATISVPAGISGDPAISQLFTLVALSCPKLSDFDFWCGVRAHWAVFENLKPLCLRHLSIQMPQFVVPNDTILQDIGAMWPQLEVLNLILTAVSFNDLLCVSTYLPRLKQLSITLPNTSPLSESLGTLSLSPALLEARRAVWFSHPFKLIAKASVEYNESELDTLARILAMTWPNMQIEIRMQSPESCRFLERKLRQYSDQVLNNGIIA